MTHKLRIIIARCACGTHSAYVYEGDEAPPCERCQECDDTLEWRELYPRPDGFSDDEANRLMLVHVASSLVHEWRIAHVLKSLELLRQAVGVVKEQAEELPEAAVLAKLFSYATEVLEITGETVH